MKMVTVKGEKRRHPRVPVGLTMDIHARGSMVGKCRGTIADLSVGGMSFKTNVVLEEGMCIYLKINVPMEIRGEIRHFKGSSAGGLHRYGVRFHKIAYQLPEDEKPRTFVNARFDKNGLSAKTKTKKKKK